MDAGAFREAVNRGGGREGVDIHALSRAADRIIRLLDAAGGARFNDELVQEAIMEARALEARTGGDYPVALPETDASAATDRAWRRALRPVVDSFRERVFDSDEAPFSAWGDAVDWIESSVDELPEVPRSADSAVRELLVDTSRLGSQLARRGWKVGISPARTELEWASADRSEFRHRVIEGFDREAGVTLGGAQAPAALLAQITSEWSRWTGFEQHALVEWFLVGDPPARRRVRLTFVHGHRTIGAQPLESAHVALDLWTPYLTWEELRTLHTRLREVWKSEGWDLPETGPPAGRRWTRLDARLEDVVDELGGVPYQPTREWWEEVDGAWTARGWEGRSPEAHRRHWSRLLEKKEEGLDPSKGPQLRLPR